MSRLPLIQPVSMTVKPVDKSGTSSSSRRREAVKKVAYGTAINIDVQVYYTKAERRNMTAEGNNPDTSGSVSTRQWVLDDASYVPAVGDKITHLAGKQLAQPVFVEEFEPSAHLGGVNTLRVIRWRSKSRTRKQ